MNDNSVLSNLFEPYVWEWFQQTYAEPSPPQVASWPRIAKKKNTLIFSPTGSGKTLAAFLWCINALFRMGQDETLDDSIYVLYISPLKALNNDIQKNLVDPLKGIYEAAQKAGSPVQEVRSAVRTGDTTAKQRAAMSRRPPHILITTPESLFIMLSTDKFRHAFSTLRYVIVDEIHAISDNKRGVHLSLALERLQYLVPRELVRIGLSATQRPLEEIARYLVGLDSQGQQRPCEIVDVGGRKNLDVQVLAPVDNLMEAHFDAIWGSSYDMLLRMIAEHDTTLIFANSRYKTERTALRLNELADGMPIEVGAHHGSMSKNVRLQMENDLKQAKLDALVATSSLELGIDVGSIDLVCQLQSPKSVSSGMQRIGRAGHLLDATSKGRLLVVDRDDLVESVVLVNAIYEGDIDTTRIPQNCLDVLAQHIVGAVAADPWTVDELYALCRQSYCFRDLPRDDYEHTLDMLSGNITLEMEYAPYPKINWDKVNQVLHPEPGSRMIAFRSSGTIPDVAEYSVYYEARKTVVGKLGESFVEELHTGDVFILGSSSWQVLGIKRNRVLVKDVYGKAPTIPFWFGDRPSRTYDLGVSMGAFRKAIAKRLPDDDALVILWLVNSYHVNEQGARALLSYYREQQFVTGMIPDESNLLVEHFRDELGNHQIVIHSPYGIRVHDPWALLLAHSIEQRYKVRPITATVDDGMLIVIPKESDLEICSGHAWLTELVNLDNVDALLAECLPETPIFKTRFRHNAVRSLMVLREYKGRHTPVWLQGLRSSSLLDACKDIPDFPITTETLRECTHEALDVPNFKRVLWAMKEGAIAVHSINTQVPSPFSHALLLVGQYIDPGSSSEQERRGRLMHLHRELLKQILDKETLANMLDESAVRDVEERLQYRAEKRIRNANELARLLLELGDLVTEADTPLSMVDRIEGDAFAMLDTLMNEHRAVYVPLPTTETHTDRWIATENFPLYRDAFAVHVTLDEEDEGLLAELAESGPVPMTAIKGDGGVAQRLERLVRAYHVVRIVKDWRIHFAATRAWIPANILGEYRQRDDARREIVFQYLRRHGPTTRYEIMEQYGFPAREVEQSLLALYEQGSVVRGEYVPTKSFPQWCYRPNLEEIHRLTLQRMRKEMEPATPEAYADFMLHWLHAHPDTQLEGLDGLRTVIEQMQGFETYQILLERDIFSKRVKDYSADMLDTLFRGGEVQWRRFGHERIKRGQFGFMFRRDQNWLPVHPTNLKSQVGRWDDDIPHVCDSVREYLRSHGASWYDDIVANVDADERLVMRAIWHLAWMGEAIHDSYESVRYMKTASGLSGCYDLATRPTKKGVTIELIIRHMEARNLDPRLGRWAPTERLLPDGFIARQIAEFGEDAAEVIAERWAQLLLKRYGIFCKDMLQREVGAPPWKDLRKAFMKMEILGTIRRGYFVDGLSGEQYALPEAVEALREAKLRQPDNDAERAESDDLVLLNIVDLANPYGFVLPLTDASGDEVRLVKVPTRYLILQAGRPVMVYEDRIRVLDDLTLDTTRRCIQLLKDIVDKPAVSEAREEISLRQWNYHPTEVSPARHLLMDMGFYRVQNRHKVYVYDGTLPEDWDRDTDPGQPPEVFPYSGKEKAPVVYDADWVISQAAPEIRPKVRELIDWLKARVNDRCEFIYRPRYFKDFQVLYRGMRCINPHIQLKKIWLSVKYKGWSQGMQILPETDINDPAFIKDFERRFDETCAQIDEELDKHP